MVEWYEVQTGNSMQVSRSRRVKFWGHEITSGKRIYSILRVLCDLGTAYTISSLYFIPSAKDQSVKNYTDRYCITFTLKIVNNSGKWHDFFVHLKQKPQSCIKL